MLNIFFFQLYDKDVYLVIHIQNNNIETKIKTKIFLLQEKNFVDGLCKYSDITKFALKINENESCELHLSKDIIIKYKKEKQILKIISNNIENNYLVNKNDIDSLVNQLFLCESLLNNEKLY